MSEAASSRPPSRANADRRAAFVVLLALLASTCWVGALAPPAAADELSAPTSDVDITGTLEGEDGRYIAGLIGVELFDAEQRRLDANGCVTENPSGYTFVARVNERNGCCYLLDGDGVPESEGGGLGLEKDWRVDDIPANAAYLSIEVYPKGGASSVWGGRYGGVWRHRIDAVRGPLDVNLPLKCGLEENGVVGSTGVIDGTVYMDGAVSAATPSRVIAWSTAPDSDTEPKGWGFGTGSSDGKFRIESLAPGAYTIRVTDGTGVTRQEFGVEVRPCETTDHRIAVRGELPPAVDDPAVLRGDQVLMRYSTTSGEPEHTFELGLPPGQVVSGDFDGDGVDTLAVYAGGRFHIRNSNTTGSADQVIAYGRTGDVAVVGDWNGDGTETLGVRRRNVFHLRNTLNPGPANIRLAYGRASDTPVVGDWNGDGTDTFGVRRGNAFYLRNRNTTGVADVRLAYGRASDRPVVGDWNGDGTDTFGVRRGATYHLRNRNTTGVADVAFDFGTPTDTPIVGDFDGW